MSTPHATQTTPESFGTGKIAAATFERVIATRLGAHCADVLVGPQHGVDAGIIDLGGGRVMAITTDPFFVMPRYGWQRASWFAVHIVASDACMSGLSPSYCAIDLNLPLSMTDAELEELWQGVHLSCQEIGLAVVTGHTGRYDGCDYPMLGAATIIGVGEQDRYLTPAMARPGDRVIITKGAAIETTGMFGATFPRHLAAAIGEELARAAEDLFCQMSVVKDALTAIEVGVRDNGVTTLHDATERGVWGGLVEIAEASRVGLLIDQAAIILPPSVQAVCTAFDIDPYAASSEGTLLLTCRPKVEGELLARFAGAGIPATCAGEMTPQEDGIQVVRDGKTEPLVTPTMDPFWPAFSQALEQWSE